MRQTILRQMPNLYFMLSEKIIIFIVILLIITIIITIALYLILLKIQINKKRTNYESHSFQMGLSTPNKYQIDTSKFKIME